jgi:hypothetical protein
LTTDEKGSFGPFVNVTPPSPMVSVFNLLLGGTLSTEAQRVDKIGAFFTVSELKALQVCPTEDRNRGPFILQNDLKLEQWLTATMISVDNGDTPAPVNSHGPFASNVLSHEVKFDIISSGAVTPVWILRSSTLNQPGNFLGATRDRTQDLIITFGPPDPQWLTPVVEAATGKVKIDPKTRKPLFRPGALAPAAASSALASEIGNAVSNGLMNARRP